jgi:hypothetical protein
MTAAGFPHSGIAGSKPTCGSPTLIAAYRALLRLSVPRHPPCALISLDRIARSHARVRTRGAPVHRDNTHVLVLLLLPSRPTPQARTPTSLIPTHYPCFQLKTPVRECTTVARPVRTFRPEGPTRRSRKEVIQPQVPLRLPCYDFAPVIELAFGRSVPCGFGHGLRALPTSMA